MVETLRSPKDWNDLNELLWEQSFDPETRKHRPYTAFRGLSEMHEDDLATGLQRIRGRSKDCPAPDLSLLERRLIDTFRNYAQEHYPAMQTDWHVLSLSRHYRLPTRLIDWTMSPYVALFFATENADKWDKDGVIWCASRKLTRELLPAYLKDSLVKRGTYFFTVEVLQREFESLVEFDKLQEKAMIWFEPASISPRIVNQYAFFSVMPGVHSSHTDYFHANAGLAWRIPIPWHLKPEIHDRLQVMNLTHRTIYPGLEGIALWLKAYYAT
jgi:FRG domain-containing protein